MKPVELAGLLPSGRQYRTLVKSDMVTVTVGRFTYTVGVRRDGAIISTIIELPTEPS